MNFDNKYISDAICIIHYKQPDNKIRYQVEAAEKAFRDMFSGQAQQTNVPDSADPNQPRFIFKDGKKELSISMIGCQLQFRFYNDIDLQTQLSVIEKNISIFQRSITRFKPNDELKECAIVLNINFSSKEETETLLKHVFNQFIRAEKQINFGDLASCAIRIGYKTEEQLYINYEIDTYDLGEFNFQNYPQGQPIFIKRDDMKPIESGVYVKLDINNKPLANMANYTYEGVDKFFPIISEFVTKQVDEVLGIIK